MKVVSYAFQGCIYSICSKSCKNSKENITIKKENDTLYIKISVPNPSIYLNTVVLEPLCHWNQCRNSQRTRCLCPNEWSLLSLNHLWKDSQRGRVIKPYYFHFRNKSIIRIKSVYVCVDSRNGHRSHSPLQLQVPMAFIQTDNLWHPGAEPLRHLLNCAGHGSYLYFSSFANDEGVWRIWSENVSPRRLRALLVIPSTCIIPLIVKKYIRSTPHFFFVLWFTFLIQIKHDK